MVPKNRRMMNKNLSFQAILNPEKPTNKNQDAYVLGESQFLVFTNLLMCWKKIKKND